MTHLIFVGYSTKVIEGYEKLMPAFTGRTGTKDEAKIAEQIAEKKQDWLADAKSMPYVGTFDTVHILIPTLEKAFLFKSEGRGAGTDKPVICRAVRDTLLKLFPTAWPEGTHTYTKSEPEAAFMGFSPRGFLKMLGIECSLPINNCPLPPSMWFGNTDHRDIEEAVMPKDYKGLDWPTVIKSRRVGLAEAELPKYDALFANWTGPGVNPEADTKICWLLCGQMGFAPVMPTAPPAPAPAAEKTTKKAKVAAPTE